MSEFIVFQANKSIGPDFNKAAAILKQNKDIKVVESFESLGMFVIKAPEAALDNVKKSLPGWDTENLIKAAFRI